MATTDIGRAVPLMRGEYSPFATYELNDIVTLNGSMYWHYSHAVTTNVAPQATDTWMLVLDLTAAEEYISRAESAAETAEEAKDDAVTAKTAAETASASASGSSTAASAAETAAETAKEAAIAAKDAAVSAKTDAESAKTAAQTAATAASGSATAANSSAGNAEYYAGEASTAATTATEKASEASASAATASSAATTATGAKDTAVSSAATATTKAGEASTSATSAASSAAAAQAVKDSIPQDYTALSEDVADLKTQIVQITVPDLTKISGEPITGKYINAAGAVADAASGDYQWEVTDYVDVSGLDKVAITASAFTSRMYYAFYDTNKTYIPNSGKPYVSGVSLNDEIVDVPSGAKYCVAMWYYTTSANDPIIKSVGLKPKQDGLVKYDDTQSLTDEQKATARQNIGAVDEAVTEILADEKKLTTTFTNNYFINQADGSAVGDSRFSASDFVYIGCFTTITYPQYFTGANASVCLYDRNRVKTRSFVNSSGTSGAQNTVTIQSGEYYARFTCNTNNLSNFFITVDNYLASAIKAVGETIENDRNDDSLFSKIIHDGGFTRIFNTMGVIGDSLSSGEMAYGSASTEQTTQYVDMFQYSWIQYIARECGTTAHNFSQGGMNTRNFLTDLGGWLTKLQNPDYKCQAYFIALGHNDKNYSVPVGTPSDINISDPALSADTYYGNYAHIISIIKTVQPNAKIFCVCMKSSGFADYNVAIRYMATIFTNVYILDFETYYPKLETSWEYTQGHGNAMGYLNYSWQIGTYVDWIIRHNRADFKYVQFIGTDYDQYIPTT